MMVFTVVFFVVRCICTDSALIEKEIVMNRKKQLPLAIDTFCGFSFLSNIAFSPKGESAAFTLTRANVKENRYDSWIWLRKNGKNSRLTGLGRESRFVWLDEETIGSRMAQEQPIFIFIDNLSDLMTMVYRPSPGIAPMSGFLEHIIEKGKLHNIYFIAGLKVEDEPLLMGYKAYTSFIADKNGIHLGGNLAGQKIFNFQNISFADSAKTLKKGFGHISTEEDEGEPIVIPACK